LVFVEERVREIERKYAQLIDLPPDDLLDPEELGAMKQRGAWEKANALRNFQDYMKEVKRYGHHGTHT
jgi:hypothetical protein